MYGTLLAAQAPRLGMGLADRGDPDRNPRACSSLAMFLVAASVPTATLRYA